LLSKKLLSSQGGNAPAYNVSMKTGWSRIRTQDSKKRPRFPTIIYKKTANKAPAKPSERTGSRRAAAPLEGEGEPELVGEVLVLEVEDDLVPEPEVVAVPEPDEPPVVLFPLLLPPVVVPLEAAPPDDGEVLLSPVLPLPEPTGTVLLLFATGAGAEATGAEEGTGATAGADAGAVATDGWVVTGSGWVVTTVGMPVITPRELVWVVNDVKGLVYNAIWSVYCIQLFDQIMSSVDVQTGAAERTRDRAFPLSRVGSFTGPYVHMHSSPSLARHLEAGQQPQRRARGRRWSNA